MIGRRRFFGALSAAAGAPAQESRKPNLVIILADDLGYADLGFQGAHDIPTPHLDRLARGGVRFTNGFVSHPFCSPTRAGLMTGRYQQRFGHETNPVYNPADPVSGLPTSETTLPQLLKSAGYVTGHIGKWHLGAHPQFHPMKRGFDEMFGFLGGGHDYFKQELYGNPREYLIPHQRDGRPVQEPEYLTDALGREAAAFVRRHKDHPFFLYLAFNAPHTPQQVSEKHLERFADIEDEKRRKYAAMVNAMDEAAGRALDAIRETGNESNTLVVFLSDNGGPTAANGSSNAPLRGVKGQVYDGGIRVPFTMRWPALLAAGREYKSPVISLDILPTLISAAGGQLPEKPVDGVDLLPFLTGMRRDAPHERLYWRTGGGTSWAVREGRFKLVKQGDGEPTLYDVEADIGESKDVGPQQQTARDRLLAAYSAWNRELIPPLFEGIRPANTKAGKKQ
ncbi:MAG: sulfatase-like hydrolase/transferase [Bryobacteraceae bacterium]